MRSGLAAVAVLGLALGACTTVGPDFKAPAPPEGAAASGYAMAGDPAAPSLRLDGETRAVGPWWQALGSPELDRVIRMALANSPTVAEARATLELAAAQSDAVRGEQALQADLDLSARRSRINSRQFGFSSFGGLKPPTLNLFSVGSEVSYDLDLFGGGRRETERASARAEAKAREADAAYLALSGNVAREAVRAAALRARIVGLEAVIVDDRKVIDMLIRAYQVGGEPLSSLNVPMGQLAKDEAELPKLRRDLAYANHQLALLVGRSPADWTPPAFELSQLTLPSDVPVALPSLLVRRRPDILAAEAELHAATAAIGIAQANRYPDVRLSATLTQTDTGPDGLFGYGASGWNLFSGLSAPVLNGGALKAKQRAAEADARIALARYQETVVRAFVQVSDVLAALGADRDIVAANGRALATAQARVGVGDASFRLGAATQRQVVEVQQDLNRARMEVAQSRGRQLENMVKLYAATAADWRPAAAN